MSSKAFQVLVAAIMLPLLSGCVTGIMWHDAVGSKSDYFSPTAIYKSKSDGSLAVEGTLTKAGEQNGVSAYLIVPQDILFAAHLQTKGDVTFKDISSLPPQVRQKMYLRKELNSNYKKIASVQSQGGVDVNQRTTVNIKVVSKAVGLLPFTFVVDAVTFPLQIYIGKKMSENPIE
jgi:uncharacterized protein YceK